MQFKIIRYRDQQGIYHKGNVVQCLRRAREVSPDFPEGKNVQRVVAKFDRVARELPADVASVLTPEERKEWAVWREREDETHMQSVAQYELDTLTERVRVARIGLAKNYAMTTMQNIINLREEVRALLRVLTEPSLMTELVCGRPEKDDESEIEWLPNFATPGTTEFESYRRLLERHARLKAHDQRG